MEIPDTPDEKIQTRGSFMPSETTKERRWHERFTPMEDAFAVLRPDFNKLGKVKDVSVGGLSFEYIEIDDPLEPSERPQVVQMDLFSADAGFFLKQIPCRVVYDIDISERKSTSLSLLRHGRCGVCFDGLTEGYAEEVRSFLDQYVARSHPAS